MGGVPWGGMRWGGPMGGRSHGEEVPTHGELAGGTAAAPSASTANCAGAIVAVRWMEQCGEGLGFRVPNPAERARATGRGGYYAALGLSQRGLFDLVGDHLDPDALLVRIGDPIVAWLHGGGYARWRLREPVLWRLRGEPLLRSTATAVHMTR